MAGMSQMASREVCPAGTFSTTEGCPKMMEVQDLLRGVPFFLRWDFRGIFPGD